MADKLFPELKFITFLNDAIQVGSYRYYPLDGQMSINDKPGPVRARVAARVSASLNEDSKTVLIFCYFDLDAKFGVAVDEFAKRTGVETPPSKIVKALTHSGVESNAECYDIARDEFAAWKEEVREWAELADALFVPRDGDVVVDNAGTVATTEPAPEKKKSKKAK